MFHVPARLPAFAAVVAVLLLTNLPVSADSGSVSVTATNNAKLTMTIGSPSAAFGSALDPTGAGTGGQVSATAPAGSGDQGVYYVWSPGGALVTVKSNKIWNGTLAATENSGSAASLTIASGALRYAATAPSSYASAAAANTFGTTATTWQTNHAKGNTSFNYNYLLRVDWSDDPGTFSSTVTYAAAQ